MLLRLKEELARHSKLVIHDDSRIRSAVLIPLYYKQGTLHTLFTRRTSNVRDHKGQISFPGGAFERWDCNLFRTAVRECTEEIGLAGETIELLGELDDILTMGSNYIVSPFVASIPCPYKFALDAWEVEEVIEFPVDRLLDKSCRSQETSLVNGQSAVSYYYNCGGKIVWGATARILNQFLAIYAQVASEKSISEYKL